MRKAVLGGVTIALFLSAAVVLAPSVWAQARSRGAAPDLLLPLSGGSTIGVSVRELTEDEISDARLDQPGGVFVQSVRDGSPAARAGLRSGDMIVEFDGERVRGVRQLSRLVRETAADRTVSIAILREGTRQIVEVTPEATRGLSTLLPEIGRRVERGLRSLPRDFNLQRRQWEGAARGRLGLTLSPLTDQLATYFGVESGMLVSTVDSDSAAAQAGIRAGDVITTVDGQALQTPADIARLRDAAPGATLEVHLVRDKTELVVQLTVPEPQSPVRPGQIPV